MLSIERLPTQECQPEGIINKKIGKPKRKKDEKIQAYPKNPNASEKADSDTESQWSCNPDDGFNLDGFNPEPTTLNVTMEPYDPFSINGLIDRLYKNPSNLNFIDLKDNHQDIKGFQYDTTRDNKPPSRN